MSTEPIASSSTSSILNENQIYELPGPRTGSFTFSISDFKKVLKKSPVGHRIQSTAYKLPACSNVATWSLIVFPTGLRLPDNLAVFLQHSSLASQPLGYRCTAEFTFSVLPSSSSSSSSTTSSSSSSPPPSAENHPASSQVASPATPPPLSFTKKCDHVFTRTSTDRGFMSLFTLEEFKQSGVKRAHLRKGALTLHVSVTVISEYVERRDYSDGWMMRPACKDVVLMCPHCDSPFEVISGNCLVFRHGVYISNGRQISPHASQSVCEKLVADGLIYGCGKPVKAVYDQAKKEWAAEKCDYI